MYKLIRSLLFLLPAETAHYVAMDALNFFCSTGFCKKLIVKLYAPGKSSIESLFGLQFINIVGLGAGFDKNARYLTALETLGFGFIEIGTVTPLAQDGNPKPRLFRLPADKALINRMGFNNEGAQVVADRLKVWRENNPETKMIIGGNIGKNKITPNDDAWQDYEKCFKALHPYVDYFVVNVSSPNTPGLRELQEKDSLSKIFSVLEEYNLAQENRKPVLLKIAPDLNTSQIDEVIQLALEINLDGLIVSNTTISRKSLSESSLKLSDEAGAGGLSGLPLKEKNTELLTYMCKKLDGKIPVIASGGIFTKIDGDEKIKAGARLLQVWTGFIYEGPGIVKGIVNCQS